MRVRCWVLLVALVLAGCGARVDPPLTVQLPLTNSEKKWVIEHLLGEFERREEVQVNVLTEASSRDRADVFVLAQRELAPSWTVTAAPLPSLATDNLFPPALAPCTRGSQLHFLPLFLTPQVVVYSRSAALDAYLEWEQHRSRSDSLLKRYNGQGLPSGYQLEADPGRWDLFDLVVLSQAWGPSRVGIHLDEEHFLETFAQFVYCSGGTEDELVRGKGPGVRNAHYWLRFFQESGTLRRFERADEQVEQLARGELSLGVLTTREAFSLYRGEAAEGVLADLAIAPLPRAASFYLDRRGQPFFEGTQRAVVDGFYAGVNPQTPRPDLALAFILWMLEDKTQQRLGEFLGFYPVNLKVQEDIVARFRQQWTKELYVVTRDQVGPVLPVTPALETVKLETRERFFKPAEGYRRLDIDRAVYQVEKKVAERMLEQEEEPVEAPPPVIPTNRRQRLVFWKPSGEEAYQNFIARAVSRFEENHPGVLVETRDLPMKSDEQYRIYLDSFSRRDDSFDVFAIDVIWAAEFARSGYLSSLDKDLSGAEKETFLPSCLAACSVDGQVVALPWYTNSGVTFYRRDLLEKQGLAPPRNYEELSRVVGRLDGIDGLVFQGKEYEGLICCFLEFLHGSGVRLYGPQQREVAVSREELEQVLARFRRLLSEGVVPENVLYFQEEESRLHFVEGRAAFLRNWPYVWGTVQDPKSPLQGKVGVLPPMVQGDNPPRGTLGGWQLAVNPHSPHRDLAVSFIKQLCSLEWQKAMYLDLSRHPTLKAVYDDPEVLAKNPLLQELYPVFATVETRPPVSRYHEFSLALQRELTALLLDVHTPREASNSIRSLLERFTAGD